MNQGILEDNEVNPDYRPQMKLAPKDFFNFFGGLFLGVFFGFFLFMMAMVYCS